MKSTETIKKPFVADINGDWKDLNDYTSECGANNYFFENNTIHFVITGKNCMVRVR